MAEVLLDTEFLNKLKQLTLISKKIFAGKIKGERRSRQKGASVEFADYRDYVRGDDPRFIDWNMYGRLERLFLKLFQEEQDLSVYILVDGSESMAFGSPSKFLYAKRIAAALGYISLINMDRVGVGTFASERLEYLVPTRGKGQGRRLFAFLEKLEPEGRTALAASCRSYLLRHRRPGLLILISDFFDRAGFEETLKVLLARNLEVYAIQVLAEEERNPPIAGDLRLIDCEEKDATEITVTDRLIKHYKAQLESYCESLRDFCMKRGVNYLAVTTRWRFEDLILQYLKTAGLLK